LKKGKKSSIKKSRENFWKKSIPNFIETPTETIKCGRYLTGFTS
jgi:hypothetical protein